MLSTCVRSRNTWMKAILLTTIWLAALVSESEGQSIEGRIVGSESNNGVALVEVTLATGTGSRITATTSDWDGSFRFGPIAAGQYILRFGRLGFTDTSVEVNVALDSVSRVEVTLLPSVILIDGVEVNVRRGVPVEQTATYDGLYSRRNDKRWANITGPNRVFVRSDMVESSGMTVRQFVRSNAPPTLGAGGLLSGHQPARGVPNPLGRTQDCQPVFLDRGGVELRPGQLVALLERHVADLEGIEVYSNTWEAPVELRPPLSRLSDSCGVVVVWPRRRAGDR